MKIINKIYRLIVLFSIYSFSASNLLYSSEESSFTSIFDENEYGFDSEDKTVKELLKNFKDSVQIFFFNVGQGNFSLIKQKENAIIVDAGSGGNFSSDKVSFENIKPIFLTCLNEAKIKAIIISHTDDDHCNFLSQLTGWLSSDFFIVFGGNTEGKEKILKLLNRFDCIPMLYLDLSSSLKFRKEDMPSYLNSGQDVSVQFVEKELNKLIKDGSFQFLNPINLLPKKSNNNDFSLIFKFTYGGNSILFSGDATENTYFCYCPKLTKVSSKDLKKTNKAILHKVNLFEIPHHGASTSGSQVWTDIVIKYNTKDLIGVVVSVGLNSNYSHPTHFLHTKPWPLTMASSPKVVMTQLSMQNEKKPKKTSKKMKKRILETGLSRSKVLCFSFTPNGSVHFINDSLMWECIMQNNVPQILIPTIIKIINSLKLSQQDFNFFSFLPKIKLATPWIYKNDIKSTKISKTVFPKLNYSRVISIKTTLIDKIKIKKTSRTISVQKSLLLETEENSPGREFLRESEQKQNSKVIKTINCENHLILNEISIPADGDCGYTALGMTREDVALLLIQNLSDNFVQKCIQKEITFLVKKHAIPLCIATDKEAFINFYINLSTLQFATYFPDYPLNYMNCFPGEYSILSAIAYLSKNNISVFSKTGHLLYTTNFSSYTHRKYLIFSDFHFNRGVIPNKDNLSF